MENIFVYIERVASIFIYLYTNERRSHCINVMIKYNSLNAIQDTEEQPFKTKKESSSYFNRIPTMSPFYHAKNRGGQSIPILSLHSLCCKKINNNVSLGFVPYHPSIITMIALNQSNNMLNKTLHKV